jgi:crotonobetainyl-CoA hydratase
VASDASPVVKVTTADHTLVATINRPEALNAVNQAVWDGLGDAVDRAQSDPQIRVMIITGAGDRAFCAGADLKAIANHEFRTTPHPRRDPWGFAGIATHPISKPVIAAVNGLAYGGGWEIVLACDLVVASEGATFALPEVARGLIAGGGGAIRLGNHLPPVLARELLFTGDIIDASRAASLGLVNAVVPQSEVLAKAFELASRIAANAPLAVQATKRIAAGLLDGRAPSEDLGWQLTRTQMELILATEDAREGPRAFADKRTPVWQGK